ncbi:MAG: hypothetical protein L0332_06300 [Chloroflexi bacterium]|nr:hypothetical protein [Chloroflexota bacterium]MCI0577027.1 hypothetical protein [Chloroflexota bacterium]MCI0648817.1 hypothetical protein [Chloroflexota bacterium]MCI0726319.1 hypothetical protein [Chloroflexota bacterium]
MNNKLERALDDCLEHLVREQSRAGDKRSGMEKCLEQYPDLARELRPLLLAAQQVAPGRLVRLAPAARQQARARLLAHMQARPRGAPAARLRLAYALAMVALIFLTAFTTAAQAALPGNRLYGWKVASEQLWRAVHPDDLAADLILTERRADELIWVSGDPIAEPLARQNYQVALERLATYTGQDEQATIQQTLLTQREKFDQASLAVPALEALLGPRPGQAPGQEGAPPLLATPTLPQPEITPAGEATAPAEATLDLPLPLPTSVATPAIPEELPGDLPPVPIPTIEIPPTLLP